MQLKLIAAAIAVAFAAAAQAQTSTAKDQEEERIKQAAKADKERCNSMKGNAKDICMAEAKGKEKVARAELDASKDANPRNQRKVAEAKLAAEYDVAKERCDDQKGDAKDQCQKAAKDKRDQARRQVREQYAQKPERPAATGATATQERKAAKDK